LAIKLIKQELEEQLKSQEWDNCEVLCELLCRTADTYTQFEEASILVRDLLNEFYILGFFGRCISLCNKLIRNSNLQIHKIIISSFDSFKATLLCFDSQNTSSLNSYLQIPSILHCKPSFYSQEQENTPSKDICF
jgi:hypothetical protein